LTTPARVKLLSMAMALNPCASTSRWNSLLRSTRNSCPPCSGSPSASSTIELPAEAISRSAAALRLSVESSAKGIASDVIHPSSVAYAGMLSGMADPPDSSRAGQSAKTGNRPDGPVQIASVFDYRAYRGTRQAVLRGSDGPPSPQAYSQEPGRTDTGSGVAAMLAR